jgi:hypothetical protein
MRTDGKMEDPSDLNRRWMRMHLKGSKTPGKVTVVSYSLNNHSTSKLRRLSAKIFFWINKI